MENKSMLFENEEFGSIRTIQEGEIILFCGIDVAKALGYAKPRNALERHTKGALKRGSLTNGGVQELRFIPEGEVYRLIVGSKLPTAEAFERWLFDEVVPSIRKNGIYATENTLRMLMENPVLIYEMAQEMLRQRQRADGLSMEVELLRPKAEYFDQFVSPTDCTNIRNTAKELGVPERRFCKFLVEEKLLYRCPAGNLMPYNKHKNEGLFIVRDFYGKNGHFGAYTLITPMGKDHIRVLLLNTEI